VPDPIRPARVVLRVADVERSARFYADLVGLEVATLDLDAAQLRAPGTYGETLVELRRAAQPGLRPPERATGLFHTAFLYPGRPALGAALRRLAAAGAPLTGASDHLVSEALYLRDPDGHGIELYRDRPREEWPEPPPGARVAMDTLPLDVGALLDEDEIDARPDDVVIGHVHLRVADVAAAADFWEREVGLELMARFGAQAAFLASGGYHHHVGVNTWSSAGAGPEPAEGPGLDAVVLRVEDAARAAELRTPDGLPVVLEP
jgi:catechol 2,3-dioxygenase